jgi:hypothetical protein
MVSLTNEGMATFKSSMIVLGLKGITNIKFDFEHDIIIINHPLFDEIIIVENVQYEYNKMGMKYAKYCYDILVNKYPELLL